MSPPAAALTVLLVLSTLSAYGFSGDSSPDDSTSTRSAPSQGDQLMEPIERHSARSPEQRRAERIQSRLLRHGLDSESEYQDDGAACAEHSYGEVRAFFLAEPCVALHRARFTLTDDAGNVALLAVAWVRMPDPDSARDYQALADIQGTGNITELSREHGPHATVRYGGDTYASRRRGSVVVTALAEPVASAWSGSPLATVVAQAAR